jgi:hypothetical protein
MHREEVTFREYKVMLQQERFIGKEERLLQAAREFWQDFNQAIAGVVTDVKGDLNKIATRREIKFYDTDDRFLYRSSYIFRERCDIDPSDFARRRLRQREVTLKFRHPDRYISQDRSMKASEAKNKTTKFEEDIKSPFSVLYSFSTTQPISPKQNLDRLQDLTALYPDFADELELYNGKNSIQTVKASILELVIKGATIGIRKHPQIDAECALIVWYDKNERERPVAVEFSFRYGDENEGYTRKMSQRAYDVFLILPECLKDWIAADERTKTAFIYS